LPVSLPNNQHDEMDHGFGMLNNQLLNQPDTFDTTSPVVDDQFNYLYPKPPPSSPEAQPSYNHNSEHGLDPDIYYSTMHWPSNQQQSYQHQQLSMHSRHVRPDDETTPGDWSMDINLYSDKSYNYTKTSNPKPSPNDCYDQTPPNIDYQLKVLTKYDNHNADHELAVSVRATLLT
jgi:hypothetical protein